MILYAIYDFRTSPTSFNFAEFLCLAEKIRIRAKADKIHVVFVVPEGLTCGQHLYGREGCRKMIRNVCEPMGKLLPSFDAFIPMTPDEAHKHFPYLEEDPLGFKKLPDGNACFGLGKRCYGFPLILLMWKERFYPFKAEKQWCPIDPNTITMTPRRAKHSPTRNNDMGEWLQAKAELEANGYPVIVIDEEEDLLKRAAMYSQAKLNIMACGGPSLIAGAMGVPYLMMKPITEGIYCSSQEFWDSIGMHKGKQYPGARKDQILCWDEDKADVILENVEKILNLEAV